jgi:hypothetical protein
MPRGPEFLVKMTQGSETVYLFCSSASKFPSGRLKSNGLADLQAVYNNSPKADGVAILSEYPPAGPTLPNGTQDSTLDWDTYAARIQVGP